jgi:hypothetical protein
MGMSKPVYVLPRGAEVEDIVNITSIAVVDAQTTGTAKHRKECEAGMVAAD